MIGLIIFLLVGIVLIPLFSPFIGYVVMWRGSTVYLLANTGMLSYLGVNAIFVGISIFLAISIFKILRG